MFYMDEVKEALVSQAKEVYKDIKPCKGSDFNDDSFTVYNNKLVFWFNVENKSTKILMSQTLPDYQVIPN